LFEAINEEEFKTKLEETLNGMQDIFKDRQAGANANTNADTDTDADTDTNNFQGMPNAEDIHEHISGMMNGKLGKLAKEIAEETAADLNMDMDGATNVQDVFQKLMKNPGKLMGLVKNVGSKLESRMKSGDIKESELIAEAAEMLNKMKAMPGMGNIREMLSKMGMGGLAKGAKLDLNAMESKLNQTMKMAKMKERMRQKVEAKQFANTSSQSQSLPQSQAAPSISDDALFEFIEGKSTNESNLDDKKLKKKGKKKGNK
jgi:hypothetical protein